MLSAEKAISLATVNSHIQCQGTTISNGSNDRSELVINKYKNSQRLEDAEFKCIQKPHISTMNSITKFINDVMFRKECSEEEKYMEKTLAPYMHQLMEALYTNYELEKVSGAIHSIQFQHNDKHTSWLKYATHTTQLKHTVFRHMHFSSLGTRTYAFITCTETEIMASPVFLSCCKNFKSDVPVNVYLPSSMYSSFHPITVERKGVMYKLFDYKRVVDKEVFRTFMYEFLSEFNFLDGLEDNMCPDVDLKPRQLKRYLMGIYKGYPREGLNSYKGHICIPVLCIIKYNKRLRFVFYLIDIDNLYWCNKCTLLLSYPFMYFPSLHSFAFVCHPTCKCPSPDCLNAPMCFVCESSENECVGIHASSIMKDTLAYGFDNVDGCHYPLFTYAKHFTVCNVHRLYSINFPSAAPIGACEMSIMTSSTFQNLTCQEQLSVFVLMKYFYPKLSCDALSLLGKHIPLMQRPHVTFSDETLYALSVSPSVVTSYPARFILKSVREWPRIRPYHLKQLCARLDLSESLDTPHIPTLAGDFEESVSDYLTYADAFDKVSQVRMHTRITESLCDMAQKIKSQEHSRKVVKVYAQMETAQEVVFEECEPLVEPVIARANVLIASKGGYRKRNQRTLRKSATIVQCTSSKSNTPPSPIITVKAESYDPNVESLHGIIQEPAIPAIFEAEWEMLELPEGDRSFYNRMWFCISSVVKDTIQYLSTWRADYTISDVFRMISDLIIKHVKVLGSMIQSAVQILIDSFGGIINRITTLVKGCLSDSLPYILRALVFFLLMKLVDACVGQTSTTMTKVVISLFAGLFCASSPDCEQAIFYLILSVLSLGIGCCTLIYSVAQLFGLIKNEPQEYIDVLAESQEERTLTHKQVRKYLRKSQAVRPESQEESTKTVRHSKTKLTRKALNAVRSESMEEYTPAQRKAFNRIARKVKVQAQAGVDDRAKRYVCENLITSFWEIIKGFWPGNRVNIQEQNARIQYLKHMKDLPSLIGTSMEKFWQKLLSAIECMANYLGFSWKLADLQGEALQRKALEFYDKVRNFEIQYKPDDDIFVSGQADSSLYFVKQKELVALKKEGEQIERIIGTMKFTSEVKTLIDMHKDTQKKVQRWYDALNAAFTGSVMKHEPLTVFFHGAAGVGKSLLIDYLMSDLYDLNGKTYFPVRDRFNRNLDSKYYEGYHGQEVYVIDDFLQSKNEEIRTSELVSIIHMGSRAPFPLETAAVDTKGKVFFISDYVLVTSNADYHLYKATIEKHIQSFEALDRRIDLSIEVKNLRPMNITQDGEFDHSNYSFLVNDKIHGTSEMDYEGLLERLYTLDQHKRSIQLQLDNTAPSSTRSQIIDRVRNRVVVQSQGVTEAYYACKDVVSNFPTYVRRLYNIAKTSTCKYTQILSDALTSQIPYVAWLTTLKQKMWAIKMVVGGIIGFWMAKKIIDWVGAKVKIDQPISVTVNVDNSSSKTKDSYNATSPKVRAEGCLDINGKTIMKSTTPNFVRIHAVDTGASVSGIFIKGHIVLAPSHVLKQHYDIPDDAVFVVDTMHTSPFTVKFRDVQWIVFRDLDLMLFEIPHNVISPRVDITSKFITDNELRFRYGPGLLYRTEPPSEYNPYAHTKEFMVHNIHRDHRSLDYEDEIDVGCINAWNYRCQTSSGECGSLLFHLDATVPHKIIGMHVAGRDEDVGFSTIITQELLAELLDEFKVDCKTQSFYTVKPTVELEDIESGIVPEHGWLEVCGILPKEETPYMANVTAIVPSLLNVIDENDQPIIYQAISKPAPLHQFITPSGEKISPLRLGLEGWNAPSYVFPQNLIELVKRSMVYDLCKYESVYSVEYRRKLTVSESINGIPGSKYIEGVNMHSSPGYPYVMSHLSKFDLLEGEPGERVMKEPLLSAYNQRIASLHTDQVLPVWCIDALKDERRPIAKADAGKTRIFYNCSMDANIVMRQYYLSCLAHMMTQSPWSTVSVGVDVHSTDWTHLFLHLQSTGPNWIGGDYSCWDKTVPWQVMISICEVMDEWYNDGPEESHARLNIAMACLAPYHIAAGTVWRSHQGMVSGIPLTASGNSLANIFLLRMAYAAGCIRKGIPVDFSKIRMCAYGDDHLVSVPNFLKWFNMQYLQQFFAKYGIVYTDAAKNADVKEFESLDDLTYLKRKFVKDGQIIQAPLDLNVIREMVLWVRKSKDMDLTEATIQNCESALRELTHYPCSVWNQYYKMWNNALRDRYGVQLPVTSYEECRRFRNLHWDTGGVD